MEQDHALAQSYLKHFGDASKGGMLNTYRKADGTVFACWPKDVCREWDADINSMLSESGLLGDFRTLFEPSWNLSVGTILGGDVVAQDKLAVSGYIANLVACTPTWKRIGAKMSNEQEPQTGPSFNKAIYTRQLIDCAITTYGADWRIIENPTDQPFVCSDNPLAYWERGPMVQPTIRYVPITPRLCLEISYDGRKISRTRLTPDDVRAIFEKAPTGTVERVRYNKAGARFINRVVAQCAEDVVFSSVALSGIEEYVKKYARWRIEVDYVELPGKEGEDATDRSPILAVREATSV